MQAGMDPWRRLVGEGGIKDQIAAIREKIGAVVCECGIPEHFWDLEGVCMTLEGAERHLVTVADNMIEAILDSEDG